MNRARFASSCMGLLGLLAAGRPLLAIDPIAVPLGPPTLLNPSLFLLQPLVGMADDGSFTIGFFDGTPGELERARAQLFGADGTPASQWLWTGFRNTAMATAPDGGFVVIGPRSGPTPGSFLLQASLYDAQGTLVKSSDIGPLSTMSAAGFDAQGNFVVVYSSGTFDFRAARFDAQGLPRGGSFPVAGPLEFGAGNVDLAVAADGSFTVFFEEGGPETGARLFRRRYDSDAKPLEDAFPVPPHQLQRANRAAVAPDGRTAVIFNNDSFGYIDGQYFDADGQLGPAFSLSHQAGEKGLGGQGVFVTGGDLVAASNIDVGNTVYRARLHRIGPDGQPRGPRLLIERPPGNYDGHAPLIAGHGDRLAVVWSDPQGRIHYQRFEATLFADGFESGDLSGWN